MILCIIVSHILLLLMKFDMLALNNFNVIYKPYDIVTLAYLFFIRLHAPFYSVGGACSRISFIVYMSFSIVILIVLVFTYPMPINLLVSLAILNLCIYDTQLCVHSSRVSPRFYGFTHNTLACTICITYNPMRCVLVVMISSTKPLSSLSCIQV